MSIAATPDFLEMVRQSRDEIALKTITGTFARARTRTGIADKEGPGLGSSFSTLTLISD